MEKEEHKIKILSICSSDVSGGAARAAYRIHCAVNDWAESEHLALQSEMFVLHKGTHDSSVHALSEFLPHGKWFIAFDWVAQKIRNKIQHWHWRPYKHTQDKNFKSDMRGRHLYGALEHLRPDIIHLHWINHRFIDLQELYDFVRKEERHGHHIPIVWTLHDSWPFCGTCHYFLDCQGYQQQCGSCPQLRPLEHTRIANDLSHRVWQQKAALYCDLDIHVVSPSNWLADCAKKSSLFRGCDIRVIPNCLDTNLFSPSQGEKSEKRLAKPFVLYGAMQAATDKRKGFASLLSALQIIERQYIARNEEVPFDVVVFGANASDLPIETSIPIHYMGYIYDSQRLVELYRQAAVMVVPSLTENLSCTIMEALSCGTLVTAFNIGGNGDMIQHQQNGYLAQEQNPADLAQGILWCLEHNADGHLSASARQSVETRFSPEIVAKQYIDTYLHVRKLKDM